MKVLRMLLLTFTAAVFCLCTAVLASEEQEKACALMDDTVTSGDLTFAVGDTSASVTSCGKDAVSAVIPESVNDVPVTKVAKEAFRGCAALTSVEIPEGITEIGDRAFYGCVSLKEVTVPDTVTYLGKGAFYGCSALEKATLSANIGPIEDGDFAGCPLLSVRGYERTWAAAYAADNGIPWISEGLYEVSEIYVAKGSTLRYDYLKQSHVKIVLSDGVYSIMSIELVRLCDVTIEAEHPGRAEILCISDTSPVLTARMCTGIELRGLIMGHRDSTGLSEESYMCGATESGYSNEYSAQVLVFRQAGNVTVDSCDLWGCGLNAVFLYASENVEIKNSVLRDCVFGAVWTHNSTAVFSDCIISGNAYHEEHRDKACVFIDHTYENEDDPAAVTFAHCDFYNNWNPELMDGHIYLDGYWEEKDGIQHYVNRQPLPVFLDDYFEDCTFHDNAWQGYTPNVCGVCAAGGAAWQVSKDGKVLTLGKDLSFSDGGTVESGDVQTPLYGEFSLPWIRYLNNIERFEVTPGCELLFSGKKTCRLVIDLAAAGVGAGTYTLIDAGYKKDGEMGLALYDLVEFDGSTPVELTMCSDGWNPCRAIFILDGEARPVCGRIWISFVYRNLDNITIGL